MQGRIVVAIARLLCMAGVLSGQSGTASAAREHADKGAAYAQAGDLGHAESELRRAVELAPNDTSYLTSLGGILGMQQKLEEANIYFEKAVKADPNNATSLRNLGANLWQLRRLKQSQIILERLLRIQAGDKVATLLLGMVSENQHDYARAVTLLTAVPEMVVQRPESVAALASAYYHTGSRGEAHKVLEGLLGPPGPPQGIFAAAGVAADAEDYGIAEQLFESIRSVYPDATTLEYNLALIRFRTQRVAESHKMLLELVNAGRATGEIYNLLGWCYQKENNPSEAVQALDNAIRLDPAKESNYLDLQTILVNGKKFPSALEVARKTTEAFPRSDAAYSMQGGIELKMSQFTDAARSYSRAVELNPKSLNAKVGLASAQWSAGMHADAEVKFKTLLKEYPHDAVVYETYGTLLLGGDAGPGTEARAVALLNKALALDSSRAEPNYQLGLLELKKSTTDSLSQALQQLENAERLGRNDSQIHYALARVYRRLGRGEEAAKEMELYEQLKAAEADVIIQQPAREIHDK